MGTWIYIVCDQLLGLWYACYNSRIENLSIIYKLIKARTEKKKLTFIHLQRNATSRTVLFGSCIAIFAYRITLDSVAYLCHINQIKIIY